LTYFLDEIIGSKSKIIYGYKDVRTALLINEIDARFGTLSATKINFPEWLTKGYEIQPILQLGSRNRHKDLPDVPNAYEFAKTQQHKELLNFYGNQIKLSRLMFSGPGMSKKRVKELHEVGKKLAIDKDYLEDAKKLQMQGDFVQNDEVENVIKEMLATPKEVAKVLKSR
jgi:uncharacterized protein YciI